MASGPIELIRQATPGQRRTLLAAAMGWALDALDAVLCSLLLALLMRDLQMSKTPAGFARNAHAARFEDRRRALSISGRSHWAKAALDGKHSYVAGMLVCLWIVHARRDLGLGMGASGPRARPWWQGVGSLGSGAKAISLVQSSQGVLWVLGTLVALFWGQESLPAGALWVARSSLLPCARL